MRKGGDDHRPRRYEQVEHHARHQQSQSEPPDRPSRAPRHDEGGQDEHEPDEGERGAQALREAREAPEPDHGRSTCLEPMDVRTPFTRAGTFSATDGLAVLRALFSSTRPRRAPTRSRTGRALREEGRVRGARAGADERLEARRGHRPARGPDDGGRNAVRSGFSRTTPSVRRDRRRTLPPRGSPRLAASRSANANASRSKRLCHATLSTAAALQEDDAEGHQQARGGGPGGAGRGLGEEVGGPVEGGGVIGYGDAAPTV